MVCALLSRCQTALHEDWKLPDAEPADAEPADAQARFREEYVPAIVAGAEPTNRFARVQHQKGSPDISVRGLFQAYVDHLKKARKVAGYQAERILLKREDNTATALGADRAAKSIEPETIVSYLANIHVRRGVEMAHNIRAYISSAYSFGIMSAHNYTRREVIGKWDIKVNPVAGIPTDPAALKAGERFLTIVEFRLCWERLSDNYERSSMAPALHLMMATGQRVQEILCLTSRHYDAKERLVFGTKQRTACRTLSLYRGWPRVFSTSCRSMSSACSHTGPVRNGTCCTPDQTNYALSMRAKLPRCPSLREKSPAMGLSSALQRALGDLSGCLRLHGGQLEARPAPRPGRGSRVA